MGLEERKAHWPLVLTAFLGMSDPPIAYYFMGLFIEIIAYQTRLFMPVNSAREIVAKLAA